MKENSFTNHVLLLLLWSDKITHIQDNSDAIFKSSLLLTFSYVEGLAIK